MTLRPCLDCGEPSTGPRCPEHTVDTKAPAAARGYDWQWTKLSRRARKLQPWCEDCGAIEDLQTDHSPEAWAAKAAGKPIKLSMVSVVCGQCNRRRGAARGHAPRATPPNPAPKAEFQLLIARARSEDPSQLHEDIFGTCLSGGVHLSQVSGDRTHTRQQPPECGRGLGTSLIQEPRQGFFVEGARWFSRFPTARDCCVEKCQRIARVLLLLACPVPFSRHARIVS